MTFATTAPDPILQLWQLTRAWLAHTVDASGGMSGIARLIVRGARRVVARRLRAFEILVMKLLLVEAADVDAAPPPREHGARARTQRALIDLDLTQPETWRVRFTLCPPPAPQTPAQHANSGPRIRSFASPVLVRDVIADRARRVLCARMAALRTVRGRIDPERERRKAETLARRFEALRRVFVDPKPYAMRLKRKLLSLAAQAYDAAMRIVLKRPPAGEIDPKAATLALMESARAAPEVLAPPSG